MLNYMSIRKNLSKEMGKIKLTIFTCEQNHYSLINFKKATRFVFVGLASTYVKLFFNIFQVSFNLIRVSFVFRKVDDIVNAVASPTQVPVASKLPLKALTDPSL